jgi:hypothetical protein
MVATSQPGPDEPPSDHADPTDSAQQKRELLYSSVASMVIFCVFLSCTLRGILPAIYTTGLGIVLSVAVLVRFISIGSSHSASSRQHASTDTEDSPLIVWVGFLPVPMTRQGYVVFLAILILITVIAGVVTTYIRHHLL